MFSLDWSGNDNDIIFLWPKVFTFPDSFKRINVKIFHEVSHAALNCEFIGLMCLVDLFTCWHNDPLRIACKSMIFMLYLLISTNWERGTDSLFHSIPQLFHLIIISFTWQENGIFSSQQTDNVVWQSQHHSMKYVCFSLLSRLSCC